jgi:phosphatidylglycerophosphate synthase
MSETRPTIKAIRASLSPEKRRADGPWTKLVLRPLSYPGAWAFLRLGFSPNAVTYLSALLCLAGLACLAAGSSLAAWVGFGLFFLFGVLDCVDGNMARVLKKAGPWGEWVDALGGYTAYAAILLGLGVAADASVGAALPGTGLALPWPAGGWTLVGGAAAAANLLMRAVFQNFRVVSRDSDREGVGGEKRLSETIGITGFLVPLAALAYGFGLLPWVVLAYFIVYGGGCLVVMLKLIRRVEREIAGPR